MNEAPFEARVTTGWLATLVTSRSRSVTALAGPAGPVANAVAQRASACAAMREPSLAVNAAPAVPLHALQVVGIAASSTAECQRYSTVVPAGQVAPLNVADSPEEMATMGFVALVSSGEVADAYPVEEFGPVT